MPDESIDHLDFDIECEAIDAAGDCMSPAKYVVYTSTDCEHRGPYLYCLIHATYASQEQYIPSATCFRCSGRLNDLRVEALL